METRGRQNLFLLDYDESEITGAKLPSNGQVLRVLFYNMRKVKLNLRTSAHLLVKEVQVKWDKARIPTKNADKCVLKVEALYNEWKTLHKSCQKQSSFQEQRQKTFTEKFDDLFDISHANALDMISIEEDKLFLINQRKKGRPGSMIGSDLVLLKKERKLVLRREAEKRRHEQHAATLREDRDNFQSLSTSDEDEVIEQTDLDAMDVSEEEPGPSDPKKIRGRQNFITPELVSVLDKCKISDRDAVRILIATAKALKQDVNNLVINSSSIHRCRSRLRVETGQIIRTQFQENEVTAVTVHWDGKILPSLMGKEKVERLPVVISFSGTEQLLGIPAITAGTGKQQAAAVFDLLKEWDLVDKVEALGCDTTASNLGRFQGACVILEQKLGKDLLYLPCRHHIFEILLRNVFEEKMQKSSEPGVQIFNKFQGAWSKINKNNFKCGIEDKFVKKTLDDASQIIEFSLRNLEVKQPRDDYKELLQLAIVFLGGTVPHFSFRKPGAFHHARWMAKAIYCLKIFLFRNEFELNKHEHNGIRDVCIFIAKVYLKIWIQAPNAAEAPMQDLLLLQNLYTYRALDENISNQLIRKFCNHLWYLAPETVALSFFDASISYEEKKRMVIALNKFDVGDAKKLTIIPENIASYIDKNISDFISERAKKFFIRFSIPTNFLTKDPEDWKKEPSYNFGLNFLKKLNVVNDSAERAVKLMEDFNKVLSRNEEEKQLIMQIVTDYRKSYPDANKSTLLK